MKQTYCSIFNYASHYREEIYRKMELELDTDLFFGNIEDKRIKKINYSNFSKKVVELQTVKLFSNFVWIKGSVALCFKSYRIYILTGEPYCLSTWMILIINKFLGKKTYLWTHGWYGKEQGARKTIKKLYFALSTKLLLYGDYAKKLMIEEGVDRLKLEVIYNSLDYENQLQIRENLVESPIFNFFFQNDFPVIIFTGRLTAVKKLDQLLRVQKKLIELGTPINVFILGDGKEKNKLNELSKELNLNQYVFFYGECYDEHKIAEFYYNANLCVSPGNVGLTGIHAMTYGCPVISHDNFKEQMPEFEVIIPGLTGFFFHQDDMDDLVMKIILMLQHNRQEIKNNCFNIIDSKFNTRYQIDLLKKILL